MATEILDVIRPFPIEEVKNEGGSLDPLLELKRFFRSINAPLRREDLIKLIDLYTNRRIYQPDEDTFHLSLDKKDTGIDISCFGTAVFISLELHDLELVQHPLPYGQTFLDIMTINKEIDSVSDRYTRIWEKQGRCIYNSFQYRPTSINEAVMQITSMMYALEKDTEIIIHPSYNIEEYGFSITVQNFAGQTVFFFPKLGSGLFACLCGIDEAGKQYKKQSR